MISGEHARSREPSSTRVLLAGSGLMQISNPLYLLPGLLVVGVLAQWIASRIRIPAIVLLLGAGIVLGPLLGVLRPDELLGDLLTPIVSLAVGVILFEGGLSLRLSEAERLGAPAPTQPRDPGPMAFAERDYVRDILEGAGFASVAVDSVETTLRHAGGVAAAAQLSARLGPAARIIKERDGTPEDIAAIAQRIESDFAPFATSGGIAVPALLNLVEARKGSSVP